MKTSAFLPHEMIHHPCGVLLGLGLLLPCINASALSVDLRAPIGGEVYVSADTMRIEWISYFDPGESADNLQLYYAWMGSSDYHYLGAPLSPGIARGSYSWTVPTVSEVSYLRIKAGLYREDGPELARDVSYTVTILPNADTPSVHLVDPQPRGSGTLALPGGSAHEIRWETTGCVSPHTTVPMTIEFSTSPYFRDSTEVATVNPCTTDHFSWTVPAIETTHAYLRLQWGDLDRSATLYPFTIYLTGPPNAAPIADAGDAVSTAELVTAYLDGRESRDPEGGGLTYAWRRADAWVATYPTTLVDAHTATPHFTAPEAGDEPKTLTFRLTVTDPLGATDTDYVNVQVIPGYPISTGFSPSSGWFKTPVSLTGNNLGGGTLSMHGEVVATIPEHMHHSYSFSLPDLPVGPSALTLANFAGSHTTPSEFEVLPVPYQWDWGFPFRNPTDYLLSWEDYERAFGESGVNSLLCCDRDGLFCIRRCHDFLAQLIWDGYAHEMAMSGTCWGVSVASLKYYYGDWTLDPGETVRHQWFNLDAENDLTRNIKALHLSQLSAETIGYLVDHVGDSPETVVGRIIADLDAGTPGVLSLQNVTEGMDLMDLEGHAMVPVHYEELPSGEIRIYVYDSNREEWSQSRENDDPATFEDLTSWETYPYILVDTDGVQTWEFTMAGGTLWRGDNRLRISVRLGDDELTVPFSGLFYFPRSVAVRSHYTFPTSLPGIFMILGGSADGSTRDAAGHTLGYDAEGRLRFEIPGAVPLVPYSASSFRRTEAYLLPQDDYTVLIRGNASAHYQWQALNQDFAVVLDTVPCEPGWQDVIRWSPSSHSLIFSPATDKPTYRVQLLTSAAENNLVYRRTFELHNLSLKAGDLAAFRIRPDRKSVALVNGSAEPLSVDALLSQVQLSPQPEPPDLPAPEDVSLYAQTITVPPGSTTVLTPEDWFSLPTSPLNVDALPDTDGDGLDDEWEGLLGTSAAFWDTDQDQMSDSWEYRNGLDPLQAQDAAEDPDQDGADNRTEYEKGTDPWDPVSGPEDSRADLLLIEPAAPGVAATGENIELTWTVKNQGAGEAAASWEDRVYLSFDSMWDGQDTLLASVQHTDPLSPREFYTINKKVRIPVTAFPFDYILIFVTDVDNGLAEVRESNNEWFGFLRVDTPNLTPIQLDAPQLFVTQNEHTVSWVIQNQGAGDATWPGLTALYLSEDDVLDGGDAPLASVIENDRLPAGAKRRAVRSFTMPYVPAGSYQLILHVDRNDQIHETNEEDNVLLGQVEVRTPNLVPTGLRAPAILVNRQEYSASWDVQNQGSGEAVRGWITRLLLSEDTVVDPTDLLIVNGLTTGQLPPGQTQWSTVQFTLPEGTEIGSRRHYLLQVDPPNSQVAESREDDNVLVRSYSAGTSAAAGVVPPDSHTLLNLRESPTDPNDMGVQVMSLAPETESEVALTYRALNPPGAIKPGYELLDGTLEVALPSLVNGEFVLLVVRDYGHLVPQDNPFEVRPLRIMRRVDYPLDATGARWQPAECLDQSMGGIRFTPAPYREVADAPMDYLGQRGHAPDQRYVWAVVDHASDFAIGYATAPLQPVVASVARLAGGRLRLDIVANAGEVVRVESAGNLRGDVWDPESVYETPEGGEPLSQITSDGGFVPLHLEPNGQARFYRVLVE